MNNEQWEKEKNIAEIASNREKETRKIIKENIIKKDIKRRERLEQERDMYRRAAFEKNMQKARENRTKGFQDQVKRIFELAQKEKEAKPSYQQESKNKIQKQDQRRIIYEIKQRKRKAEMETRRTLDSIHQKEDKEK